MSRYPYSILLRSADGWAVGPDIECDLDAHVDDADGTSDPFLVIDAVWMDGRDIMRERGILKAIAVEIVSRAEKDDDLLSRAMEDEGIYWSGRGPNDPDGSYRRAA